MENKIYNDDCFDVFDKIEKDTVDMVLVDLPYGQTACEWDINIDLQKMWKELKRICKGKCQFVFFTTTKYGNDLINSNKKYFKYDLVWEKHNAVGFFNCNRMPLRSHEMIYIFINGKLSYNPQKVPGEPYYRHRGERKKGVYGVALSKEIINTGERFPRSVLKYGRDKEKLHSTQKPLELCEWLIKTYSNEGDLVMDFCMGSGTTVVGCLNTNRRYIGVEKDKDILKKADERINKFIV
jgi:site-specific DNA-methyltransferase (adenine-specific)